MDGFSRMGYVFGEEAWVRKGWRNALKSQLFASLGCSSNNPSKADYKARGKYGTT